MNNQNNQHSEEDMLALLEVIILGIMLIERLEDFQLNHYNKMSIKNKSKALLADLTRQVERDYALVFKAGEEDVHDVVKEYEKYIASIREFNLPQKVALSRFIQAWNFDKETMEATISRLIKKESKQNLNTV